MPADESVEAYAERVQLYFVASDILTEKHVAVLLSVLGGKIYGLLRNLVVPDAPVSKSYDEIISVLKRHFEPKPLFIAERFHFHRCSQQAGESVADFAAELRRLTTNCEFKQPFLDELLRDQFMCGLRSETAQKRLLTEREPTFAKAVEIAQSLELAAKNASQLQTVLEQVRRLEVSVTCAKLTPPDLVIHVENLTTSQPSVPSKGPAVITVEKWDTCVLSVEAAERLERSLTSRVIIGAP